MKENKMNPIRKLKFEMAETANLYREAGKAILELGYSAYRHIQLQIRRKTEGTVYKRLPDGTPLYINCQPYVVRKTRREGENELVKLAIEVPYEGEWDFTSETSDWFHRTISHTEEYERDGGSELSSTSLRSNFLKVGDEIVNYHTHPKVVGEHWAKAMVSSLAQGILKRGWGDSDSAKRIASVIPSVVMYSYMGFPSSHDIVRYSSDLRRIKGNVKFIGRIGSPMGITNIKVNCPSEETSKQYEQIHNGLIDIILKQEFDGEIDIEKPISVDQHRLFKKVQKDMQGKIELEFEPAENCSLPLLC